MLNIYNAPNKGKLFATFSDKGIRFEDYNIEQSPSEVTKVAEDGALLELHLFDDKVEYRYVKTRGRGDLETIVSDRQMIEHYSWKEEEMDQHIYEEKGICVSGQGDLTETVNVINYIDYDENDLLHIVNYRLVEV